MGRSEHVWGPYERDPENPILTSVPGESYERHNPDHLKPKYYNPASVLQKSGHGSYVETPESSLPECPLPRIPDFDDFDSGELGSWYYAPPDHASEICGCEGPSGLGAPPGPGVQDVP